MVQLLECFHFWGLTLLTFGLFRLLLTDFKENKTKKLIILVQWALLEETFLNFIYFLYMSVFPTCACLYGQRSEESAISQKL